MTLNELEQLRLSYIGAYSAYLRCLHEISAASQRGQEPTEQLLREELGAFSDFASARDEMLRALMTQK